MYIHTNLISTFAKVWIHPASSCAWKFTKNRPHKNTHTLYAFEIYSNTKNDSLLQYDQTKMSVEQKMYILILSVR